MPLYGSRNTQGHWYAFAQRSRFYAGTAFWLAAIVGGLIPQLILGRITDEEMAVPGAVVAAPSAAAVAKKKKEARSSGRRGAAQHSDLLFH